jgi:hypothetical protein
MGWTLEVMHLWNYQPYYPNNEILPFYRSWTYVMVAIFMLVFLLNFFSQIPCSLHTCKYKMRNYIIWNFHLLFHWLWGWCEQLTTKENFSNDVSSNIYHFFSMHYLCHQGHKRKLNLVSKVLVVDRWKHGKPTN